MPTDYYRLAMNIYSGNGRLRLANHLTIILPSWIYFYAAFPRKETIQRWSRFIHTVKALSRIGYRFLGIPTRTYYKPLVNQFADFHRPTLTAYLSRTTSKGLRKKRTMWHDTHVHKLSVRFKTSFMYPLLTIFWLIFPTCDRRSI